MRTTMPDPQDAKWRHVPLLLALLVQEVRELRREQGNCATNHITFMRGGYVSDARPAAKRVGVR